MTTEEEVNKADEISKETRDERRDRRGGDGEISEDWDRQQDRRYLDEFKEIFSQGNDRDGSGKQDNTKEESSKEWDSEFEGYEEW